MHFINFEAEADLSSTSWARADPTAALVERTSPVDYSVMLRDGETSHTVTYARWQGSYVGRCDCKGYEYRDDEQSPCAHLCVLRKAEFLGCTDVAGRPIEADYHAALEEARARSEPDVDEPAAGDDGTTFGRPEGRQ